MLTISFPGYPTARAILIDKPVSGVIGIVECDSCGWKAVLLESVTEGLSDEIETFIKTHACGDQYPSTHYDLMTICKVKGVTIKKYIPKKEV